MHITQSSKAIGFSELDFSPENTWKLQEIGRSDAKDALESFVISDEISDLSWPMASVCDFIINQMGFERPSLCHQPKTLLKPVSAE